MFTPKKTRTNDSPYCFQRLRLRNCCFVLCLIQSSIRQDCDEQASNQQRTESTTSLRLLSITAKRGDYHLDTFLLSSRTLTRQSLNTISWIWSSSRIFLFFCGCLTTFQLIHPKVNGFKCRNKWVTILVQLGFDFFKRFAFKWKFLITARTGFVFIVCFGR